ncbi:MAG: hypothetical protein ACI965_000591 [Paraglaciecola sp.]|jgi:hypothetical protein
MIMRKRHSRLLCHLTLCLSCMVSHVWGENLQLHGFVAQGLIQARNSNFVNDDGDVSVKLTEAGINASYRISSRIRVAGQGVYLNGGNRYPEGARLDYLFVDWQWVNSLDWQVNLYLGRNKNYHWLYSSTRDVPHTRPSIILPQSIYFDVFRDVALGSDGVALRASTSNDFGDWDINWSYGTSNISLEQTKNILNEGANGGLKHEYDHQINLLWKPFSSQYQLGFNILDSEFSYRQGKQDVFVNGTARTQRLMFNFAFFSENWDIASELVRERVVFENILFLGFNNDSIAEGGYVQGQYYVSREVNLIARLDLFDRDRKDRMGRNIELLSGGMVPGYFGFMDQATVGLSWAFADNMQLRGEYHRIKGAGRLSPVLSPNVLLNNEKYWNMWALQLMYWF